jgi:23S rRNA (adenine2503-C2)-methyltransferase
MSAAQRPHLMGFRPPELVDALAADGVELTLPEARRVLARLIAEGGGDVRPRKAPVRREVVEALEQGFRWPAPTLLEEVADEDDGFVKLLFELEDGALVEAVRIPLHKPDCFTVCLSSQVGCAMACAFCATGRMGLTRNLSAAEIVSVFVAVRDRAPGRVTGAVFMGQGEPLHNYDEVVKAAYVLSDPCGGRIRAENISISTVGLTDRIRRFTAEGHPFRLVVSLTSALPERRKQLLPVAGALDLGDLCEAIAEHARVRGGRVTVAWVLMGGVNTGRDEVEALKARLGDVPLRVNLIDVNDAREEGFVRASDGERNRFLDLLSELEVPVVRRYSGGKGRHAACGMLANVRAIDSNTAPRGA